MTIDLTGGLPDDREEVFADRPTDPQMRDSVSMWVSDDSGRLGLPRIGIEAVAANWDEHLLQVNIATADGAVHRVRGAGKRVPARDDSGRAAVLGAGPLAFRCVEPFRTWTMSFRGTTTSTTTRNLIANRYDGAAVDVEFDVEAAMAVPPWIQGSLLPEAAERLSTSADGDAMGGPRYEQLFRATGRLRVGDSPEQEFSGTGLRIRRQGVRDLQDFRGHCWQSALFPDGRAFGYIAYPPREDGQPTYNEGYLFTGDGPLLPARVIEAPWLTRLVPTGEDVSVVLESELGRTMIQGETALCTFDVSKPDVPGVPPDFPVLQQAGVRYRWDGQETYGMLERSSKRDRIDWS